MNPTVPSWKAGASLLIRFEYRKQYGSAMGLDDDHTATFRGRGGVQYHLRGDGDIRCY